MADVGEKFVRESLLKRKQVKLAVNALFMHVKKNEEKKPSLLGGEQPLWMIMSLKKTPAPDKKPKRIPLSKPILPAETEVCLITKREAKLAKELIKTANITSIKKVISYAKLKKNYKSYESKRQLAALYDVFLCEDCIYHLLPKTLGKTFFSKNKFPHPVDLKKRDLKGEINKVLNSTYMSLGHGTCSAIKIGHTCQDPTDVISNIITASKEIAKIIPRGWKNIKSLNIKTSDSISLPIYNSLPERPVIIEPENEIEETESPMKKKKKGNDDKGEKGEEKGNGDKREKGEKGEKKEGIKEKKGKKEKKVTKKKETDEEKENKDDKDKKEMEGNKEIKGKKRSKEDVRKEEKTEKNKKVKKRKTVG